jgi:hypothetical protein
VQAEPFAVLHYDPAGSALDQLPAADYSVSEVLGELEGGPGEGRNPQLLPLVLDRIAEVYGQPEFATEFRDHFEAYLSDIDPDTAGAQQYRNCDGVIVATLEQAYWCGPAETWPQMAYNHAYIDFWHHLDAALAGEIPGVDVGRITGMGPAAVNDDVWVALFDLGHSYYNGITVFLEERVVGVDVLVIDQLGRPRPADLSGDIGAVEIDN